jgi:hypothetical protein
VNGFVPITRVVMLLMFAVICFGMLVPMALQRRQTPLAVAIGAAFVAYVVVNVVLWRRMGRRS